ncbi:S9 family peptidase [Bdellovibrionota bacterium FG-1]
MRTYLLPVLIAVFFSVACSTPVSAEILTVRRIFEDPSLEGPSVQNLKFSPNGLRVTFLKGKVQDHRKLDLWEIDTRSGEQRLLVDSDAFEQGEAKLSSEEKARRERKRISDTGIVEYSFSQDGNALVFPIGGAVYFYSLETAGTHAPLQLTSGQYHETDAQLSPHGHYVSYIRGSDLYASDTRTRKEIRLTRDGNATIKNGAAEFVAQEEMDRFTGHWWSEDERHLAFIQYDESKVEVAKRYEVNADGMTVEEQRYPRTGTPNVRVRLGILSPVHPGAPRWLDLGPNPDIYIARVKWLPDNQTVAVQIQSRDQKKLELCFYDIHSGKKRVILTETDPHWVTLHDDLRFLKMSKLLTWSSERSGTRQLYLYDWNGKLIRQLTHQRWSIHGLTGIDSAEKTLYFTASGESPLEQHLYRVPVDHDAAEVKMTELQGTHSIEMPLSAGFYIDRFSTPLHPPQVSIDSAQDGKRIAWIEENSLDAKHPLTPFLKDFSEPEFGSFISPQGVELYYRMLKPRGYQAGRRYPVIVNVYGGPTHQVVRRAWGRKSDLWQQIMASRGFVVFSIDNRGSSGRNREFENPIHLKLGEVEVQDQAAGVDYLIRQGIADPARIGVFGWSYGGYMALMTLLKRPDLYAAAVSVAPVTDFSLYDTHYTERYLSTPALNPKGYEESSVLKYVDRLKGHLLMVHGMADDNVLFTNSTRIYKALQDRALPFEMMTYPGGKHGLYGKMPQTHVYEMITRFFETHLGQ